MGRVEHGAVQRYDLSRCEGERGDRQAAHTSQAHVVLSFFLQQFSIFTFTTGLPIEFISLILLKPGKGEEEKEGVFH